MGTFLKVVGVIALIWFGLAAVGCSMMLNALSSPAARAAYQDAKARADISQALSDGQIDVASLPFDVESDRVTTIRLRDGSTRLLKDTPSDRLVRTLLAAKMRSASREANGGYASYSSYSSQGTAAQPHFKPGEPMVNPNPGGRSED